MRLLLQLTQRYWLTGFFLVLASLFVVVAAVVNWTIISDGLNADMMGFEAEPAQGYGYWRWFFIKRSLGGIVGSFAVIAGFGSIVVWGWFNYIKAIRITVAQRQEGNR